MNNITQFLLNHGGPVLFASVFAEEAGLPLPAAPWLLAAGALAAGGALNPALVILLATAACLVADSAWFYIGRRGGQRVLRLFCKLSISPNSCVGSTKGFFARHGEQGLLAAKFIPVLGGVMPPLAGALGMSTARFLAYDSLGSILYGSVYVATGFAFHNQLRELGAMLNNLGLSVLLVSLVLVMGYIAFKYIRRRGLTVAPAERKADSSTAPDLSDEILSATAGGMALIQARIPVGNFAATADASLALVSHDIKPLHSGISSVKVKPVPCEV